MDKVHPVFHVSMLRKYLHDESHVLEPQSVNSSQDLLYLKQPIMIMDRGTRKLRSKWILSLKVVWQYHKGHDATWEPKEVIRSQFPHLFASEGMISIYNLF